MSPSVLKEKILCRGESRGLDSSNASTADPTSVSDLRLISGEQSQVSIFEGQSYSRHSSRMFNEKIMGDRLLASTGTIPDRLLASSSAHSSIYVPDRLLASSSAFSNTSATNLLGSVSVTGDRSIGDRSTMSDDDRYERQLIQRSSSGSVGPTYEGGRYVNRRRQNQRSPHGSPSRPRARSPVRDLVVRVGLSHMFRMSELVKLGDMLQEKGYRTVESIKYLDDLTIHELGIPDRLADSLLNATGVPSYQKFGRVQPLPQEEPYLDSGDPCPKQYKKKAWTCEMNPDRDLPCSVDSMYGFPTTLRNYSTSPERDSRPSSTYKVRRQRSVDAHIDRQVCARTARQESQERSPVRDPWMESTFNKKGGSTHFGTSSVRSIAGYDLPARCRQLAGEIAPTLVDRTRFSWLQGEAPALEDASNLRDKSWSATSPPPRTRGFSARSTPNLLESPKCPINLSGGRSRTKSPGSRWETLAERSEEYMLPEVPQMVFMPQKLLGQEESIGAYMPPKPLSTMSQEDCTPFADSFFGGSVRTGGGSLRTAGGSARTGSARTPRTFTTYDSEAALSGLSTATDAAPAAPARTPSVLQSPFVLPRSGSPRPVTAEGQMHPWMSSPAQVAELLQISLMGHQKNAPQTGPRFGTQTPKSDLSTATPPSTPVRSNRIHVIHPPAPTSTATPMQKIMSPRAASLKQRRPSLSTAQMIGGIPTQVQPAPPQASPRIHPAVIPAGSLHGSLQVPLSAMAPHSVNIQQPMVNVRSAVSRMAVRGGVGTPS